MLEAALRIVIAYLLGSLVGALVVGKLRGGVDIRSMGSGNAGGTNALRTQGKRFAFWVFLIDIGKGWLATTLVARWQLPWILGDRLLDPQWLAAACGVAVVLGHVYPIWFGLRGGKGAATLVGVVLGLKPTALLVVLGVWMGVLLLTGFVGLATMLATAAFPLYLLLRHEASPVLLNFGIAMTLLVVYTHRANIARMRAGSENRSHRFWLLRPR